MKSKFRVTEALNPATLLPMGEGRPPTHDCIQVMDEVYSSRPDLKDEANPNWFSWFVDGSSFIEDGQRKGCAVVALEEIIIEAPPLPPGTSAQLAEIVALTRALQLAEGTDINIYTDSKYAFLTLHAHGVLWKERGMLTSKGSQVQHPQALMDLLTAVWSPNQVAVIHCYGHRTGPSDTARGNRLADKTAKQAARQPAPAFFVGSLLPEKIVDTSLKPPYTIQERLMAEAEKLVVTEEGWYLTPDNRLWVPESLGPQVVRWYHDSCHVGPDALAKQLGSCYYISKVYQLASQISRRCILCQKNNPRTGPLPPPGIQHQGTAPMEDLVVDFTQLPKCGLYHYLLVAVCTYTGWTEAWPTRSEKSSEVTRCLLREIIPRYGLPRWTQARTPCVLVEPLHPYEPGDEVWIKDWAQTPLKPCWKGPYTILLSTPTAVKVTGITPWVHHNRVKKAVSD
ncbi:uncharacterized protein LOC144326339 [Podarcis muralis]